ncbi:hypothetical protein HY357_02245 [Candidatus Roizmanbacteria bacterium]|nr:hypothetical protein [Candidatus Roizmanbacteria bacterium]
MLSSFFTGLSKLLSLARKIFLVVAVYFVVVSLFLHIFSKNESKVVQDPTMKNREKIYSVINDSKLKKTDEGKLTILIYRSINCGLIGEGCTNNPNDADKNFNKSLFGRMINLIVAPIRNPPASGLYWVYDSLQNTGFIPKTYAAEGVGFAAIKPYKDIWSKFRDVSYLILVLIIISIGFMVMFRMKLNPQTVISVENALPRIVISLILITFSFAIAGFIIDLMYVTILVSISLLSTLNIGFLKSDPDSLKALQSKYIGAGFGEILPATGGANVFQVGGALLNILPDITSSFLRGFVSLFVTNWIASKFYERWFQDAVEAPGNVSGQAFTFGFGLGNLVKSIPRFILSTILFFLIFPFGATIILGILFSITLLFFLFRIFFLLLTSYLKVLLWIIFSPFILMFEAFPGRNTFGTWLKGLVGELIVFPTVIIINLIGYVIITVGAEKHTAIFQPPFLYGIDPQAFSVLLGTGLLLMTPDLVKLLREGLLGYKGAPISLGIGTFFTGVSSVGGGAMGTVGQIGSLSLGIHALTGKSLGDIARDPSSIFKPKPPAAATPADDVSTQFHK